MNICPAQKGYGKCSAFLTGLTCILGLFISSCDTPAKSSFEYQVHVQEANTGADIPNAQVRIEVNGIAPLIDVTDAGGTARIFISASIEEQPARLIVEAQNYKKYVQNIDLRQEALPAIIQLELGSNPDATSTPTGQGGTPGSCPWVSYLNGRQPRELNNTKCLDSLRDVGISGNSQKISFFSDGRTAGAYGACQDISNKSKLELLVSVRDTIIAARFLITVAPQPVPNKSATAFRLQPQIDPKQQKGMYIKFIEFTPGGYDDELDEVQVSPNWKKLENWEFNFAFEFSGSKASAQVNEMPSPFTWATDPQKRYLCLTYEAMPTAIQSSQLDVHVSIP